MVTRFAGSVQKPVFYFGGIMSKFLVAMFIAAISSLCFGGLGSYLEANKIIMEPAYWALYGYAFGVFSTVAVLVLAKD
jgi:hypothetical protein